MTSRRDDPDQLLADARRARQRPSRGVWILAIVVSVICTGALAIAWYQDRDTKAIPRDQLPHGGQVPSDNGLWIGLILGLGIGIVVGSLLASRRKQ